MKNDRNNIQERKTDKAREDSTKYGEFISSYFAWIPLPEQKEKVNKLENITKDKKD